MGEIFIIGNFPCIERRKLKHSSYHMYEYVQYYILVPTTESYNFLQFDMKYLGTY